MGYKLGDVFSIENESFMVAETATYMDVNYLLLNKLKNDEPSKELYVYELVDEKLSLVTDQKKLDVILPVFTNKIQRHVDNYNNANKYNIN